MKTLSVAGTVAMFLVGGGILTHGIHKVHELIHALVQRVEEAAGAGGFFSVVLPSLFDAVFGVIAGAVVMLGVSAAKRVLPKRAAG